MKKLTTRFAEPEDWPEIVELHREQSKKWGTNYELPYLWGDNIPVAVVAIDEAGKIQEAYYVERTAELRFVGTNPVATAHLQRESENLAYNLRKMGYRWLECFVPRKRKLPKMIAKPLRRAGFESTGPELAHFTKDLRGSDEPRTRNSSLQYQ